MRQPTLSNGGEVETAAPNNRSRARPVLQRQPGLDGVRALALLGVLLFHSRFPWAKGGFLGVTIFFVLSGFLITGLLVMERQTAGRLDLLAFWGRRARRLTPAVLVLLVLVMAYLSQSGTRAPSGVVGDGMASALWVANWRFVLAHRSYAGLFGGSSPFEHMWSLAVEEQVYLLLPLIVVVVMGRKGRARSRWWLAAVMGALAAASVFASSHLHHPGHVALHEYYGTDARAVEPLVGGLLALVLFGPHQLRRLGAAARKLLDAAGVVAVAGLAFMIARVGQQADGLYRGGFLLAACLSAIVVAAVTQRGLISRLLGIRPLAALGRVSYGAYLFHWPIFLWLTVARTRLSPWALCAARVSATLALATASYCLIEQPIRLGRLRRQIALPAWGSATTGLLAALTLVAGVQGATGAALASGARPKAGALAHPPTPSSSAPVTASTTTATTTAPAVRVSPTQTAFASASRHVQQSASAATNPLAGPVDPSPPPPPTSPAGKANALRVVLVGDSMANGLANGLIQWAQTRSDVVIYNLAISACPVSRGGKRRLANGDEWTVADPCAWWADPNSQRSQAVKQFNPDVIVLQDGMNELPDRKLPQWSSYQHTGQPQFDNWLVNEYTAALKVFTGTARAKVLALNAVCASWEELGSDWAGYADNSEGSRRVATLDATSAELSVSGSQNVDYESYLCPRGQFTNTVAGVPNARPDGYHLSSDAAYAVAQQWLGPMVLAQRQGGALPTPTTLPLG